LPRHPEVLALAWDNACGCGRWFLSGRAAPAPAARVVRGKPVRFYREGAGGIFGEIHSKKIKITVMIS